MLACNETVWKPKQIIRAFKYSVFFNGVPFHDEWPLIDTPMENFGKGNCEPFVGD